MSQSRVLPMLGAGAVGLGGYYIWKSGGSPSAAEKKFEGAFSFSYSQFSTAHTNTP